MKRFSAHRFTSEKDIPFSPEMYSKFKFGCKDASRKFGFELGNKFIETTYFQSIIQKSTFYKCKVIVLSSPHTFIPTATYAMKNYFIRVLNNALVKNDCDPVMEAKIYRKCSYKEEYGEMSREERMQIIQGDSFHVDKELLADNIRIFLDDIIITGAHESGIIKMLQEHGLHAGELNHFLYFAELTSESTDPKIENYLNYYFVKDLLCLDKIIKNEEYLLNTRMVKYILNAPHEECRMFLQYQKYSFLHTLYHEAIGNSYHKIPDYSQNLSYLKSLLTKN